MYFGLDDEQVMIAESAGRIIDENFGREAIRRFVAAPQIDDRARALFGETGLIGILASPDVSGLGLGCVAALAVAFQAGARSVPFPLSEGLVAASALAALPEIANKVIAGRHIVAIADRTATVSHDGSQALLTGKLGAVDWAPEADGLIVTGTAAAKEPALYHVAMADRAVEQAARKPTDLTVPIADVTLSGAPGSLLGAIPPGWQERRIVLAAAELEGAARTCLDLALEHIKTRKQFGQEIGKFQALKHIAATDALHLENMSVANAYAAWAIDSGAPDMREAVAIAKSTASEAARIVAQDSIQCHGGIGFTWDYGLHFFLRRILRLAGTMGTVHDQRELLFDQILAARAAEGK